MHYNKTQIVFVLLAVLALLYALNMLSTKSVSGVIIGTPAKVSFTIINPLKDECENCFDANNIIKMIDTAHNIKYKSRSISRNKTVSRKYIEMYGIKNLPAIVVSGDIANKGIISAWEALSGEERNERIVIENLLPYYDIESGQVKGVISVILIKDETCENCFDENEYLNILNRFGMFVGERVIYDVASSEGEAIVQKYKITKVPTFILSPDAGDYPGFTSSWSEVGTIEKDGRLVFREVQKLGLEYNGI